MGRRHSSRCLCKRPHALGREYAGSLHACCLSLQASLGPSLPATTSLRSCSSPVSVWAGSCATPVQLEVSHSQMAAVSADWARQAEAR